MTPRSGRRLIVLLLLVALATSVVSAAGCTSRFTKDWPAALEIEPGTPEETAAKFLTSLAAGDAEAAAGLLTTRYGLAPEEMYDQLATGLAQVGELDAWRIVSSQAGDPARVKATSPRCRTSTPASRRTRSRTAIRFPPPWPTT